MSAHQMNKDKPRSAESVATFALYLIHTITALPVGNLDRPKKTLSHKKHDVEPRSTSDQYYDESDEPRISSSKSKKTC